MPNRFEPTPPIKPVYYSPWRCSPAPETTCGTLINDTCVVTTQWPLSCGEVPKGCFRQSDINKVFGDDLCHIKELLGGTGNCGGDLESGGILGSIDTRCLVATDCGKQPYTPVSTLVDPKKVVDELNNLYAAVCDLNQRDVLTTDVSGLKLDCLVGDCGTPITTLGQWIEAISKKVCDCCTPK